MTSFGTGQEEQEAYWLFHRLLDSATRRGIKEPTILHLSYGEELQSYIMWYALRKGLKIKHTNGNSHVE